MKHSGPADINGFAAPDGMQEPRPSSRLDHFPDLEVHEAYRGFVHDSHRRSLSVKKILSVRLQTILKDPKAQQPNSPVTIRREKKVVLELSLHSDSHPIGYWDWKGIQLPRTSSVKSGQHSVPGRLLKLSIQVSGCSTAVPNIQPCPTCWKREQQALDPNVFPSDLQPYIIDFKAENPTTLLSGPSDGSCLKADVTFHFTCFSKHHGGPYR